MKNVYLVYESNYGSIIFHNGGEATDIIAVCKTKEEAKKIFLKQVVKGLENDFSIDPEFSGKLQDTDFIRMIEYADPDTWDGYYEITIKELELI